MSELIIACVIGYVIGSLLVIVIWRRSRNKLSKPLGRLVIERVDEEPYVCGCLLLIEKQEDIEYLRQGEIVAFCVDIQHVNERQKKHLSAHK